MSRRRRKKNSEAVELNLAAMLDMAFQLLAFFVLTFRPASVELEMRMNLPLQEGVAIDREQKNDAPVNAAPSDSAVAIYEAIPVHVDASDSGDVSEIRLGQLTISKGPATDASLLALGTELGRIVSQPNAVDRVEITVAGRLSYQDFMRIMDTCSRQKLAGGKPLQNVNFKVK